MTAYSIEAGPLVRVDACGAGEVAPTADMRSAGAPHVPSLRGENLTDAEGLYPRVHWIEWKRHAFFHGRACRFVHPMFRTRNRTERLDLLGLEQLGVGIEGLEGDVGNVVLDLQGAELLALGEAIDALAVGGPEGAGVGVGEGDVGLVGNRFPGGTGGTGRP